MYVGIPDIYDAYRFGERSSWRHPENLRGYWRKVSEVAVLDETPSGIKWQPGYPEKLSPYFYFFCQKTASNYYESDPTKDNFGDCSCAKTKLCLYIVYVDTNGPKIEDVTSKALVLENEGIVTSHFFFLNHMWATSGGAGSIVLIPPGTECPAEVPDFLDDPVVREIFLD